MGVGGILGDTYGIILATDKAHEPKYISIMLIVYQI